MVTSGWTSKTNLDQTMRPGEPPDARQVGPVLQAGPVAAAIVEAIRRHNPQVDVIDRGSYWRVHCPDRCYVSRAAIEEILHRTFTLPGDLELVMSSFKGFLRISDAAACWESSRVPQSNQVEPPR